MSSPSGWQAAVAAEQAEISALSAQVSGLSSQLSAVDSELSNLSAQVAEVAPFASAAATSLPAIPAADIDGKAFRITIAGRTGSPYNVQLFLNGNQIAGWGMPGAGFTFVREILLVWSSVNQDLWSDGTPSILSGFNPSDLTFSTNPQHTITSFSVRPV